MATVLTAPAIAQSARALPDSATPVLLISPFMSPDRAAAWSVADSLRLLIERRVSKRELYVIPKRVLQSQLTDETPVGQWPISDVQDFGIRLGASGVLELGVQRTDSGFHLTPLLLHRRANPETLSAIDATSVGRAAAILSQVILSDSSLRRTTHRSK